MFKPTYSTVSFAGPCKQIIATTRHNENGGAILEHNDMVVAIRCKQIKAITRHTEKGGPTLEHNEIPVIPDGS